MMSHDRYNPQSYAPSVFDDYRSRYPSNPSRPRSSKWAKLKTKRFQQANPDGSVSVHDRKWALGVLGMTGNETRHEEKKCWNALQKRWHPDKNPNNTQKAEEMIKTINKAYGIITKKTKVKTPTGSGFSYY